MSKRSTDVCDSVWNTLIQDTLIKLSKSRLYTKQDVHNTCNLLCIALGDKWKMTFRIREGLVEFLVMPFGLTNPLASFQIFINDTQTALFDRYVIAYLDDILISSDTLDEHQIHGRSVVEALSRARLHLKPENSKFFKEKAKYLKLITGREGVKMNLNKVAVVQDWSVPQSTFNVPSFIEFHYFYQCFIRNFSEIISPVTTLDGKSVKFKWLKECQWTFETPREAFVTVSVLANFD